MSWSSPSIGRVTHRAAAGPLPQTSPPPSGDSTSKSPARSRSKSGRFRSTMRGREASSAHRSGSGAGRLLSLISARRSAMHASYSARFSWRREAADLPSVSSKPPEAELPISKTLSAGARARQALK